MAHEAKLSLVAKPAVAGQSIEEGRLVSLTSSGLHEDLPTALYAASGTSLNVFVAFQPSDNFSRPTPASMFTALRTSQFYETNPWQNAQENGPFYWAGPSTFDDPTLASGYSLLAKLGGIYTVASGCVVDSANIRVVGNLVKVADDGTGRWAYTASETGAIGRVVDWNPDLWLYTFETIRL